MIESYKHRFHSLTANSDPDEDRRVGGYSLDQLLERIAQAQREKDKQLSDVSQTKSAKRQRKSQRATVMNIHELVEFLRWENACDICVIKVPPEREYIDYFVVCGGLGTRHIRTMADNLAAEVWNDSGGRLGQVCLDKAILLCVPLSRILLVDNCR